MKQLQCQFSPNHAKRLKLDNTQTNEDTAPLEEIEILETNPTIPPYARLRPLQTFISSFDLRKDVVVIGRSPNADFTIDDREDNHKWVKMISKKHFEIIKGTNQDVKKIYIRDISMNGVFVNGVKLPKEELVEIFFGDVISLSPPISGVNYDIFLLSNLMAETIYPTTLTEYYLMTGVLLGKGGYGNVELAREKSDASVKYAVKELHKQRYPVDIKRRQCKAEVIMNEVQLMMELDHPNIVRLMDFLDLEECSYIIMEHVGGGEFFERIVDPKWESKGLGETLGRFYAYQLISAIQFLHIKGVTHRDIKPENILLVDREDFTIAKLSDFGLAKSRKASTMKTFCGTPCYIAPEIIENERTPYREHVDIWSLGVVLFTTFTGYPPFSTEYDDLSLNDQIKKGRLILLHHWYNISEIDQIAIRKMLSVDPLHRPSAKELLSMEWMHTKETKHAREFVKKYAMNRTKPAPRFFFSLKERDQNANVVPIHLNETKRYSNNA